MDEGSARIHSKTLKQRNRKAPTVLMPMAACGNNTAMYTWHAKFFTVFSGASSLEDPAQKDLDDARYVGNAGFQHVPREPGANMPKTKQELIDDL